MGLDPTTPIPIVQNNFCIHLFAVGTSQCDSYSRTSLLKLLSGCMVQKVIVLKGGPCGQGETVEMAETKLYK